MLEPIGDEVCEAGAKELKVFPANSFRHPVDSYVHWPLLSFSFSHIFSFLFNFAIKSQMLAT